LATTCATERNKRLSKPSIVAIELMPVEIDPDRRPRLTFFMFLPSFRLDLTLRNILQLSNHSTSKKYVMSFANPLSFL
jgi:hypothetical protein